MTTTTTKRLLYIDDELLMQRTFERVVKRAGFDVQFATTGGEGIQRVKHESFDVIVSDYRLADIDGLQVLSKINAIRPGMVLVLVSGSFDAPAKQAELAKAGVTLFISKPWEADDLVRALEQALSSKSP